MLLLIYQKKARDKFNKIIEEKIDKYNLIHLISDIQQNPIKAELN